MQDLLALRFRIGLLAVPLVLPWACASENPPAMMGMEPGLSPGRPPAATRPGNAVGGFAIQVPALTLMPGEEALPCYVFPLEITGPSRLVTAAVLSTQPGLHHRNVTTRAKTGDGIRTCDEGGLGDLVSEIVSGGTVLFASSTQVVGSEWHNFPAGMAFPVAADQEIVVRMHYLNASPNPITVAPHYQWYTIAEADLQQQLAPFVWSYQKFHIPPHSQYTVKADCTFPRPMHLIEAMPHMHALGRRFTIGLTGGPLDGSLVLDSDTYGARGETDIRL